MTVGCPHCSSRYQLPALLMGPGGSRIRCPSCRGRFVVRPEGSVSTEIDEAPVTLGSVPTAPAAGSSQAKEPAPGPEAGGARSEREIARAVVQELEPHAASMREAQARGRLFAEAGPVLLEAFDAYRHQAGPNASIEAFHEALRACLGIRLPAADGGGKTG